MKLFNSKKANYQHFTACGIVVVDDRILLVRHTYGTAKDRILLPGGYVKENELPTQAAEREIFEETGIVCETKDLFSMQFKSSSGVLFLQWIIFQVSRNRMAMKTVRFCFWVWMRHLLVMI